MAPKAKPAAKAAEPPMYANYAEKDPTPLQEAFAAWLVDKTGYEVDEKSVQLAVALRMTFQRSPENQEDLEARRSTAEEKAEARAARAAEREEKAAAREEAPAKVAPAKKTTAKAAAAAPATKVAAPPRRRAAAVA